MKTGDKIPVNIAGDVVAQATITAVDNDTNRVTMVVPATEVIMGFRTQLDTAPAPVEQSGTQTIITGVDRYDAAGNIIEGASTGDAGSAPVGENANSSNTGTETPVGEANATSLVSPVPTPNTVEAASQVVSSTPVEAPETPANTE